MKMIALILALLMLLAMFAGCAKEEEATATDSTTTSAPTSPTDPNNQTLNVEYDHCGLHFKLDSTYSVGLLEGDKNTFTFGNDQISGSVTFGKLADLGDGAGTSQAYADALLAKYGQDNAWIGTSTGFGYYVVSTNGGVTTVECLYIHGQNAWLTSACSTDSQLTEKMVQLIGRCGLNADEIPVE